MIDSGVDFYGFDGKEYRMMQLPQGATFFITHPFINSSVYRIITKEGYQGRLSDKYGISFNGLIWFHILSCVVGTTLFIIVLLTMIISGFVVFSSAMLPTFGAIGFTVAIIFFFSSLLLREFFRQILKRL